MNKISLSVLAALVAVAGLATPVLAQSSGTSTSDKSFDDEAVLQQLRDRGVPATNVQEWGDKLQATITLADGSSSFAYFEPDTLRPIDSIRGGNTRVLTQLDVGRQPPVVDWRSGTSVVD
jgi:hypothetical protein